MSLSTALNSALTGLQVNQRSLDIVSQNIANVATEGYSRKSVDRTSVVLGGRGAGVEIAAITREINEFLLREQRGVVSNLSLVGVQDDFFARMQDLFGTPGSNLSIDALINELAATFQAFSTTPEDAPIQIEAVNQAELLAKRLNEMGALIQSMRHEVDRNIADAVNTINANVARIKELNIIIAENLFLKADVADLEDERDTAMREIAELMNFTSFGRGNGETVLITDTGRRILDRSPQLFAHSVPATFDASLLYDGPGSTIDGIFLGATDITTEITSGEIAGLVNLRDNVLPDLYTQLLELANALHDEINEVHNQGTAYPGYSVMTGTRTFAAADNPIWTGFVKIAVTDALGVIVEEQQFDLTAFGTVGALAAAMNGMANLTAGLNGAGQLVLTPTAPNSVAINELDSAVTVGDATMGASAFFGLNDFFTGTNDYDIYLSEQQASRTTALGLAGNLNIQGSFGATLIPYGVGDSLNTIAASINADATLSAQGIVATVLRDGSGFRLQIQDPSTANMFVSDAAPPGGLVSSLGLKARDSSLIKSIAVRSDLFTNPALIAHAELDPVAVAGAIGVSNGDNTAALRIANRFTQRLQFQALGMQSASSGSLSDFAAGILALNATQARNMSAIVAAREFQLQAVRERISESAGVNLDEELANLILLENAYAASARVMKVTSELLELLSSLVS